MCAIDFLLLAGEKLKVLKSQFHTFENGTPKPALILFLP